MRNPVKLVLFILFFLCVKAHAQPHADFTSNTQQGCAPLIVQFVDASTGSPTQWLWDLGNGTTSNKQNPGAIYSNPGTYTVKLVIKAATGEDSITKINFITVYNYPTVGLSAAPVGGCAPLEVNFTDSSIAGSGTISSWTWDFGDGIISNEQNPVHTYNISDTFNVSLIVVNSFGCKKSMVDSGLVKVGGVLKAGFTYTYDNICKPPSKIKFKDTSISKTALTYQWLFGDGEASTEQNPVHIYTTSGNFIIQLTITNADGCTQSYSDTIAVGGIKSDFSFTSGCSNETITFTDESVPVPINATWYFGDGDSAAGHEVQHLYKQPGSYLVTLISDFGSCKDTMRKSLQTVQKVEADFSATGNFKTCSFPDTVSFQNKTKGATEYKWIFGDSTTSTDINPVHVYTDAGQYTVTLIAYNATGCQDSSVQTNLIQLGPPQIQNIENLPRMGCVPQTVTLNPVIVSPEAISSYIWDFGDGSTSTETMPTHTYTKAGVYSVSLIVVSSSGCSDTLNLPNSVLLGTKPNADFAADPLEVCSRKSVQFTDKSTGLITEWIWQFGDGQESTEQNPKNVYLDTGYFDVNLIVGQYQCYDTLTLEKYIHVEPPVALFTPRSSCETPFIYQFTDKSIGAKSYHWDFGDGGVSTEESPKHTYTSEGSFTVILTVTNGDCSSNDTALIDVIDETVSFNYNSASPNFCKYDSIHFFVNPYDTASLRSFFWDFGDGVVTSPSPRNDEIYHFYTEAGKYNPALIVIDNNGCRDTLYTSTAVNIFGPNAAFSNPAGSCIFSTINFNDESTGDGTHAITKWIWDYGDGTKQDTLASAPFTHTFNTTGLFNVLLKVTDNNGCYDSVVNNKAVQITQPVANFSADTLSCSDNDVRFIDSSSGVSLLYTWYFGDGNSTITPQPVHIYANEGAYDVKLVLHDKYGCADSLVKPQYVIVANPVASFSIQDSLFVCPPAVITPQNNSRNYRSFLWNFGDGNTSEEAIPTHYYTQANNYNLELIVQGYGNCYDTIAQTVIVKGPSAKFSYAPLAACDSVNVFFKAPGKNIVQYIWDYGDGGIKITTDSAVNYTYTKRGKMLPKLVIVDSAGCKVTLTTNDTIFIRGIDAAYNAGFDIKTCDSLKYNFTDSSIIYYDSIAAYKWKFGDGDSSLEVNPSHFYSKSKLYNTSLLVTTEHGCSDIYKLPVNVLIDSTTQIFATVPDSACVNAIVQFRAGVMNNLPVNMAWQWNFGDGVQAYSKDTAHAYITANLFDAVVIGTNAKGCADTVHHSLRIDPLPVVDAGIDAIICKGDSVVLNASGAVAYTWQQDASLSCFNCASPVADPLVDATYYLTGNNNFGCVATDSVNVEVKQPIHVSIVAPDTSCAGNTIQLLGKGAETYQWQPASLVSNSSDSTVTAAPRSTTFFSLIGSDSQGCFYDTANVTVTVFPYPTLSIPDSVVTINVGSEYKITTIGSPDIAFWQWMPLSGLSCTNCAEPVLKSSRSQIYTVHARNIAGCGVDRTLNVTVLCKGQNLFIPNTFSPNADGMNDYFYPRGTGLFVIKSFRIFSRIGTLVFEKSNFPPNQQTYGWDGKYKGNALQPDVYVYIAEVLCDNGTVITTKGNVTLLR